MAASEEDKCPVDHKSREAWLQQARAATDAAAASQASQSQTALPPQHPPVSSNTDADSCPVDHNARQVWLEQAKAARPQNQTPSTSAIATSTQQTSSPSSSSSGWSSYIPRIPYITSSPKSQTSTPSTPPSQSDQQSLNTAREISTIPRSSLPSPIYPSQQQTHANNEQETGTSSTGNWIYPSERMFFDAMKRKGHDPQAPDMRTVVPIHNAVNERAWKEIKEWEAPWIAGTSCAEPRLHSFTGLSTKLSPKARVMGWLGYTRPFDRHDWVVDRCGVEVEYIIDFYAGRVDPSKGGMPSFYLDVRPKLNSWDAVKTRAFKAVGLS